MDIAIKAMLAGFVFGFLVCALVLWLRYKRNLREARKLRDEVRNKMRNKMRSTIYPSNTGFNTKCKYRAVQPTISVNGFNVPKPMDAPQLKGQTYFIATPSGRNCFYELVWDGDEVDSMYMNRQIMHSTKEAAIAHAKAMLGIDPNAEV